MTLNGIQVSVPLMADELSFFKKKSGDIFNEEMTKLANGDSDYSAVFDAASTTEIERKHIVKYLLSSSRSDARIELLRDKNEDGSENNGVYDCTVCDLLDPNYNGENFTDENSNGI